MTFAEQLEAAQRRLDASPWFPANAGTETPFMTRTGKRLLYCWQPATGRHAYLDTGTDIFLSDEEAALHLP